MKISISKLREEAKTKPNGYYQDVFRRGKVDGEYLRISPDDYRFLLQKYSPSVNGVTGSVCCGQLPPIITQVKNFSQAMVQTAVAGVQGKQIIASDETIAKRREVCQGCPSLDGTRCIQCGCQYQAKIRLEQQKCPIGKW